MNHKEVYHTNLCSLNTDLVQWNQPNLRL